MVRSNGRILKAVKAVSAAALALVLGGAMLGCDTPQDEYYAVYGGSDIVGDWMPYSYSYSYDGVPQGDIEYYNDSDDKRIMSFRPSGEASQWGFKKVGTVWAEEPFDNGEVVMWRVENQTIYVRLTRGTESREESIGTYTMSGDRLTLTNCRYREEGDGDSIYYCSEETFTGVNVDNLRASLGTVYVNDPGLYKSATSRDLLWYSQSDEDEYIDFDAVSVYGPGLDRYMDESDNVRYYTNGNKIYLVSSDCTWDDDDVRHCTVSDPVILNYNITGSGNNARLSINGSIWLPADYRDYMDNRHNSYSPAKSRQNKRPTGLKTGGSFFSDKHRGYLQ
jgi:hypothetical protein